MIPHYLKTAQASSKHLAVHMETEMKHKWQGMGLAIQAVH
jgi:hypothetical protein